MGTQGTKRLTEGEPCIKPFISLIVQKERV